jgi:hypothetical protein
MNERIRELIKNAGSDTSGKWLAIEHAEKLSQLIVADAIEVLQKRFMGDLNREDMEVRRCVQDLNKHFGVEE